MPYGWPLAFDNIGKSLELRVPFLIIDAVVWLSVAVSLGSVFEEWREKRANLSLPKRRCVSRLVRVVPLLVIIGVIEGYLRAQPRSGSIFPPRACREFFGTELDFDVGLFTDPVYSWPVLRALIIFAVGCSVYNAGRLLSWMAFRIAHLSGASCACGPPILRSSAVARTLRRSGASAVASERLSVREPQLVRFISYVLVGAIVLYFLAIFSVPRIR